MALWRFCGWNPLKIVLAVSALGLPAPGQDEPASAESADLQSLQTELVAPGSGLRETSHQHLASPLSGDWQTGPFQLTPYGRLWGSMVYATQRTAPGEFTFWVFSEDDQGEDAFTIDARRTRLGIDVTGPRMNVLGGVETGGQVEIDFFGEFVTENRAGARLRHAWWEARNDDYRVLIGQTWDVISPLQPGTLNFSVGWNGGNIGFRRAQFRLERFLHLNNEWRLALQVAANQDIIADFPTEPGVRTETADWPVLEGRAGLSFEPTGGRAPAVSVGLSGHTGETGFDFFTAGPPPLSLPPQDDVRIETWSWNIDLRVEFEHVVIQGELFRGANLSAFLGGIGQGVCPCLRQPIHSTGGWLEAVVFWGPQWESHAGFGIDDPDNEDLLFGRNYNQFIFGNVICHLTEQLRSGVELTWWKTNYQETRTGLIDPALLIDDAPGRALVVEWMVRYEF